MPLNMFVKFGGRTMFLIKFFFLFTTLWFLLPIISAEATKGVHFMAVSLTTDNKGSQTQALQSTSKQPPMETGGIAEPTTLHYLPGGGKSHLVAEASQKIIGTKWAHSAQDALAVAPKKIEIELPTPEALSTLGLKEETRLMDTTAYLEKKTFVGYRLAAVLKTIRPELKKLKDADQYKVTFVCSDGYQAVAATAQGPTPLSQILSGNDFVATGIERSGKWDVVDEGWMAGKNMTPAPFYIMGESIATEAWPLMVVKIVVERMDEK